jgi:hypothetical protein
MKFYSGFSASCQFRWPCLIFVADPAFVVCRAEIELETFNAPRRRVDNEISRLTENVNGLLMHCRVLDKVLEVYHNRLWRARTLTAVVFVGSIAATVGVGYLCDLLLPPAGALALTSPPVVGPGSPTSSVDATKSAASTSSAPQVTAKAATPAKVPVPLETGVKATKPTSSQTTQVAAPVVESPGPVVPSVFAPLWDWNAKRTYVGWSAVAGLLTNAGVIMYQHFSLSALLKTYNQRQPFESAFQQLYVEEIASNNESTLALGKLVLDSVQTSVNSDLMQRLPRVEKAEFNALHRILNEDIPNLRRRASPDFPVLSTPVRLTLADSLALGEDAESKQPASPTAEVPERVPFKSHRAAEHPDLHVHFSPSTNSSPITTRDRADKKRALMLSFADPTVTPEEVQAFLNAHPAQANASGVYDAPGGEPSTEGQDGIPHERDIKRGYCEGEAPPSPRESDEADGFASGVVVG